MSDPVLTAMRDAIQIDPGGRGLATDPHDNLFTACPDDFEAACRYLATGPVMRVGIVTGFFIAHADPPCAETDGPLGALFLARALTPLPARANGATALRYGFDFLCESACAPALRCGLAACGLAKHVRVIELPRETSPGEDFASKILLDALTINALVSLEHVGPSHTSRSLGWQRGTTQADRTAFEKEVPPTEHDRCHSMRGRDITAETSPAHLLFETARDWSPSMTTIGIGDGGNEIGMGKIPWHVIRRNIPNGDLIACRVPTDHLIVAGVSNWGAYALAAGIRHLRGVPHDPSLFDPARERELLELMVERGPLVDGPTGKRQATVDGLSFEEYAKPLVRLGEILRG